MSTFLSSVDQKLSSVISNILKSPSMNIDNYHLYCEVKATEVVVKGVMWPKFFEKWNLLNCEPENGNEKDIRLATVESLKSFLCTSSNYSVLKSKLNLDSNELRSLQELIKKFQVHVCEDSACLKCKTVQLPSLESFHTQEDIAENVLTSKRFLCMMKSKLHSLSIEDKMELSTLDWLQEELNFFESELLDANWRLKRENEEFSFKLSAPLARLIQKYDFCPPIAAYQYSLQYGVARNEENQIVLKQVDLLESYTSMFNPLLLKAVNGPIKLRILQTLPELRSMVDIHENYQDFPVEEMSHTKISLGEVLNLIDSNKLNVKTSVKTEFVYTSPEVRLLMKKVTKGTENTFQMVGDSNFYEIQETFLTRYFKKQNGHQLLFAEFVVFFDFLGTEASKPKYEAFNTREDKIEKSDTQCIKETDKIPSLILISNGDVMSKRMQPKVLKVPEYEEESFDFKYTQVLLYGDVHSLDELTEDHVNRAFEEVNNAGESTLKSRRR